MNNSIRKLLSMSSRSECFVLCFTPAAFDASYWVLPLASSCLCSLLVCHGFCCRLPRATPGDKQSEGSRCSWHCSNVSTRLGHRQAGVTLQQMHNTANQ